MHQFFRNNAWPHFELNTNCKTPAANKQNGGRTAEAMSRRPGKGNRQVYWLLLVLLIGVFLGIELKWSFSFGNDSTSSNAAVDQLSLFPWQAASSSSSKSFELAYDQSYGYFYNSISNEEWMMRQELARNATFHRYVGHPRRLWDKPNLWYYNNYDPIFSCPFQRRVRGIGDGPKWTCDPHQLKRVAKERPCLMYSIGSNGNYQWEDGMYFETDGLCEIHVFDYSKNYTRKKNTLRNIHFHQWGLQGTLEPRRGNVWRTLPEAIEELGHTGRTIDILKIDCEGCEWDSFQDWIGLGVRQILVETHSLPENKTLGLEFFDSFIQNNYILYSKEVNPWGGGQYVEFSFIQLHPDFLDGAHLNDSDKDS